MKTKISRISRRTVSMVLALLMMVSILGIGSLITANAATNKPYFVKLTASWAQANKILVHYWGAGDGDAGLTQVSGSLYYAMIPSGSSGAKLHWDGGDWYGSDGNASSNNHAELKTDNSVTYSNHQETSTASLDADASTITTAQTSTLTPSLTSKTTFNEIKTTSYSVTTNPGSAGSVTSAGVFSATAAGTYTVTATVTYNAIGYSSITKTATATKSITVNNVAETTYGVTINSGAGGSVSFNNGATSIAAGGNETVQIGATARSIVATPAYGYKFNGWTKTGSVTIANTSNASTTVSASGTGTVTASFVPNDNMDFYIVGRFKDGTNQIDWSGTSTTFKMSYDSDSGYYKIDTNQTVKQLSTAIQCSGYTAVQYFYIHDTTNSANTYYSGAKNASTGVKNNNSEANAVTLQSVTFNSNSDWLYFNDSSSTVVGDVTLWWNPRTKAFWYTTPATHNVTFNPSPTGGTVRVNSQSTSPQAVEENTNYTVTVTPSTGYYVSAFTVASVNKLSELSNGSAGGTYTGNVGTADKAVSTTFSGKQASLSFIANGATSAGTLPADNALTATYGSAMPTYNSYVAPTKTGYTLQGWYVNGHKYYNADFSPVTGTYAVWKENTTSDQTLTAQWSENKAGIIVKANTDGSAPESTGGTVKIGLSGTPGNTATIANNTFGISTASSAIIATPASHYNFKGWQFTTDNYSHFKYSTDGTNFSAVPAKDTTFASNSTTIYLKTDGTTGLTTSNSELQAMFEIEKETVTINKVSATTSANATAGNYSPDASAGSVTASYGGGGGGAGGGDSGDYYLLYTTANGDTALDDNHIDVYKDTTGSKYTAKLTVPTASTNYYFGFSSSTSYTGLVHNNTVTLTKNHSSVTGYGPQNWGVSSHYAYLSVSSANTVVYISFDPASPNAVTLNSSYANYGEGSGSGGGGGDATEITSGDTVPYGTTVTFTAAPNPGYKFVGWVVNGTVESNNTTYTSDAINANYTINARFDKKYDLTFVDSIDTGDGYYTSAVNGAVNADVVHTQFAGDTLAAGDITSWNHPGYRLTGWKINGAGTLYTTSADLITALEARNPEIDATINVYFEQTTYTVAVNQFYYDTTTKETGNKGTVTGTTSSAAYQSSVTLSVSNVAAGYKFVGWFESGAANDADAIETDTSYTFTVSDDVTYEARFKKKYVITLYNTWENKGTDEDPDWHFTASPPRTVTVKRSETLSITYTYSSGTLTQRGEDNKYDSVKNGTALATHYLDATGSYYEGNQIEVLAGDEIELHYAALASSDTITGVFFNNGIRYTNEEEPDDLYTNGEWQGYDTVDDEDEGLGSDDKWKYTYLPATTLYADENYYDGDTKSTIQSSFSSYTAKNGVNQAQHKVSWTVTQNYKNIDLELANKRRFVFVDSTGAEIKHQTASDYYSVGDTVGASNAFGVKAEDSSLANYTLDPEDVKFYSNKACTNAYLLSTTHPSCDIEIADTPDGSGYYSITGTMPNTDIYVKLNIKTTYTVHMGTRIVSDTTDNYTAFSKVARVTAEYVVDEDHTYTYQDTDYNSATQKQAKWNNNAITAVNKGDSVTFSYEFWDNINQEDVSKNYSGKYMFVGWYEGDASGPDYANGFKSDRKDYTPDLDSNIYIYAVGTRDLFINGSKYITGKTYDWNQSTQNPDGTMQNIRMEFDPDYTETYENTTYKGRYYWEIDRKMFDETVSNMFFVGNTNYADTRYYADNTKMGNSFFRIMDSATGNTGYTFWEKIYSNAQTSSTSNIGYGKLYYNGDNETNGRRYGNGYISFKTKGTPSTGFWSNAANEGYDAPIRIYAYPRGWISVEATPIYPHIYVSNGYKGIDSSSDQSEHNGYQSGDVKAEPVSDGNVVTNGQTGYFAITANGNGWNPKYEGHVNDYTVKTLNGTVRITKTVSDSDHYIVSAFEVYNLKKDTIQTYSDVKKSGNNFYVDITMNENESLYIVPIIEAADADMTVIFDSTQLNTEEWGDFVSCYAWYGTGNAYGEYPGQLMVRADDGKSWSARFPSTKNGEPLVGILFANYYSYYDSKATTWIASDYVYKEVSSTRIIRDRDYNSIDKDGDTYDKTNYQAQTYDYREPIAMYINRSLEEGEELTLKFALKSGNSNGNLMSLRHTELKNATIPGTIDHVNSSSQHSDITISESNFEYLRNSAGKYSDMNGIALEDEPTASFYVMAKGMATYNKDAHQLQRVFYSGRNYEADTSYTYEKTFGTDLNYAVQWYVYDAAGNYITNVLSAAYADRVTDGDVNAQSLLVHKLTDMGYAVDGRAVAICYDDPRYCYNTGGSPSVPNGGTDFQAYRFSGQWYATSSYEEITANVRVGMIDESGKVKAFEPEEGEKINDSGYGSATISYDRKKNIPLHKITTGEDKEFVTASRADAGKPATKLSANSTNFKSWYIREDDGTFTDTGIKDATIYTSFKDNTTYYAVYEAKATYQYNFTGREGGAVSYKTTGGNMTDAEMKTKKLDKTARAESVSLNSPGTFRLFKKDIVFNASTAANLDNATDYIMNINNPTVTTSSFTLTAYYPSSRDSGTNTTCSTTAQYNTAIDLNDLTEHAITQNAPSGEVFKGWYTGANGTGELLSTQPNFGQVIVKDTTIYAHYDPSGYTPGSDTWHAYIDDQEVTCEKYSEEDGMYYNDAIIRIRNDQGVTTAIPEGAETGVLVIKDDGNNRTTTRTTEQLTTYATSAKLTNGKTAKINGGEMFVTKLVATNLTTFNRADLALRSNYASTKGQKYSVYAYIKLSNGTCVFSDAKSGTYE